MNLTFVLLAFLLGAASGLLALWLTFRWVGSRLDAADENYSNHIRDIRGRETFLLNKLLERNGIKPLTVVQPPEEDHLARPGVESPRSQAHFRALTPSQVRARSDIERAQADSEIHEGPAPAGGSTVLSPAKQAKILAHAETIERGKKA